MRSRPDAAMIAHHIGGMVLLISASLAGVVPGAPSLAFSTAVLETGSLAYLIWVLWRFKWTYILIMNFSNVIYVGTILGILHVGDRSAFTLFLGFIGLGLVAGRTAALVDEMRRVPTQAKTD